MHGTFKWVDEDEGKHHTAIDHDNVMNAARHEARSWPLLWATNRATMPWPIVVNGFETAVDALTIDGAADNRQPDPLDA